MNHYDFLRLYRPAVQSKFSVCLFAAFPSSLFNALIQQSSTLCLMLQRSNYILKISHMLKSSVWFGNQISLSLINAFALFLKHVALIVVSLWPCQMINWADSAVSFNFCSSILFYIGRVVSTFLSRYYQTTFYGSNIWGVIYWCLSIEGNIRAQKPTVGCLMVL